MWTTNRRIVKPFDKGPLVGVFHYCKQHSCKATNCRNPSHRRHCFIHQHREEVRRKARLRLKRERQLEEEKREHAKLMSTAHLLQSLHENMEQDQKKNDQSSRKSGKSVDKENITE